MQNIFKYLALKCMCYTPHEKDTLADSPSKFFLSNFYSFMFLTYKLGIEIAKKKKLYAKVT